MSESFSADACCSGAAASCALMPTWMDWDPLGGGASFGARGALPPGRGGPPKKSSSGRAAAGEEPLDSAAGCSAPAGKRMPMYHALQAVRFYVAHKHALREHGTFSDPHKGKPS